MEKLRIVSLLVLILFLTIAGGLYLSYLLSSITVKAVSNTEEQNISNNYSYTTAICNSKKECIDVLITCKNNSVIKMEPVSELLQLPSGWEDQRPKNSSYCG